MMAIAIVMALLVLLVFALGRQVLSLHRQLMVKETENWRLKVQIIRLEGGVRDDR